MSINGEKNYKMRMSQRLTLTEPQDSAIKTTRSVPYFEHLLTRVAECLNRKCF